MRRVGLAIIFVAAITGAYSLGRHHSPAPGRRHVLYYIDPMHPTYKSDKPGIAPDCGMKLTPVFAGDSGDLDHHGVSRELPAGAVQINDETQQLIGMRLATVEQGSNARSIRVVGRVVPEDSRVYGINSGVDGFIRETYNDSVGMPVKKNQKLASYYAPDFLASASGFLAANERVPGAVAKEGARSIQNYTDRLRNLGMSDVQIKQLAESHQLPESIDVNAPVDGFIIARNVSAGQHFTHDMEFYKVADLRRVWVAAEVSEQDAPYLRPGTPALITLRSQGRRLSARISDSLPQSEAGGGTVRFRLETDNPRFVLRPEMLVDVELAVHMPAAVTVPADAVLDSGVHARVYVAKPDGVFEPREVETGWRYGDRVEILRGVQAGQRVVASATFLVDSESRLKAGTGVAAVPVSDRPAGSP